MAASGPSGRQRFPDAKTPQDCEIFTVWTRSGPNGYIFAVNAGDRGSLRRLRYTAKDRLRACGGFARWHLSKIE